MQLEFFYLTKAYSIINHDLLLDKLDSYGIGGITDLSFKPYLSHREQFVEINQTDHRNSIQNKHHSSYWEMKHGIPQCSTLWPLLFSLYIKDIPLNIQGTNLVLFADDINLLTIKKYESALPHKIKNVMNKFETWFHKNNIIINTEKTIAISFHTTQKTSCKTTNQFQKYVY